VNRSSLICLNSAICAGYIRCNQYSYRQKRVLLPIESVHDVDKNAEFAQCLREVADPVPFRPEIEAGAHSSKRAGDGTTCMD